MAGKQRSSLNDIADAENERLEAIESLGGNKGKEAETPKTKPAWVTPSIQLTEEQLHLLRAVATARSKGRGRVQVSDVIRKLIEANREALEAEAGWRNGRTAERYSSTAAEWHNGTQALDHFARHRPALRAREASST